MAITTTVTWDDLRQAPADELSELRDAYEELRELATEVYGDDALDRTLPNDPDQLEADERDLWVYQTQIEQYRQAAESIEKRQNMLRRLEDEYGSDPFEIKMLSGSETMDIETELRMKAQQKDTAIDTVRIHRNGLVVDAATVDGPDTLPTTEDGTPKPSDAPNALTLSLWEMVERFNNAGSVDFRPEGFGDTAGEPRPTTDKSATPSASTE